MQITTKEAIERGLIDPKTGMYRDPRTGVTIPLSEAVQRGLVSADVTATGLGVTGVTTADVTSVVDPVTGKQVKIC